MAPLIYSMLHNSLQKAEFQQVPQHRGPVKLPQSMLRAARLRLISDPCTVALPCNLSKHFHAAIWTAVRWRIKRIAEV